MKGAVVNGRPAVSLPGVDLGREHARGGAEAAVELADVVQQRTGDLRPVGARPSGGEVGNAE